MLPDALPQLIETLLRLPHLEAAQLRELIQNLPDPQALGQEMVRRGWITQDQFSSLFPGPQQRPTPRATMLPGFGDDEISRGADGDDFYLTVSDEDDRADLQPEAEAVPMLSGPAGSPQVEWEMPVPPEAGGQEVPRPEGDSPRRQWVGWASVGLLMLTLVLGSLFAELPFFGARSTAPPAARQVSRGAQKKTQAPTAKRAVSGPQITAEKADKAPSKQAVEAVRPPELLRPPAVEGKAKDEPVRGAERTKDAEGPPRVHTIYFREGNRQWTEHYYLDKNGRVVGYDVQPVDGPPPFAPNPLPRNRWRSR